MWRARSITFSRYSPPSPKAALASALRLGHEAIQSRPGRRDTDAAPAAAGRRLDHDRIAEARRDRERRLRRCPCARRCPERSGRRPRRRSRGPRLVAHQADDCAADRRRSGRPPRRRRRNRRSRRGSRNLDARRRRRSSRRPRGSLRGPDRIWGLRRPDVHRLVGEPDGEQVRVGVAVGLHGPDPEFARRPDDADRDLAAIGDQELLDRHGWSANLSHRSRRSADPP